MSDSSWNVVLLDEMVENGMVELGRGNVISRLDIERQPGEYPVYSSSAQGDGKFGQYGQYMFDEELISWSVDGGGRFFYRPKHKFSVTNVSGYMRVLSADIDCKYLYFALDWLHAQHTFDYQLKAHPSVIRKLYRIPLPALDEQRRIAAVLMSVDEAIRANAALIGSPATGSNDVIGQLQTLRLGLLDDLLSGRVRVPATAAAR